MKTMQQKIEELENQIAAHKKQYHRNGCCYGGTNGCCDAEELYQTNFGFSKF